MSLMLHRGSQIVTPEALSQVPVPEATKTWKPVSHESVLHASLSVLADAGYTVTRQQLALSPSGSRFFGTLDLATPLHDGVALVAGIRNSIDKTFPMGFAAGSRVFVCDNLSFSADLMIRRKHSTHGERLFQRDIANAVSQLDTFRDTETRRIITMRETPLSADAADAFILRAATQHDVIPVTLLPEVVRHWQRPEHDAFAPRTAWSMYNAFTSALTGRPAIDIARRTMKLGHLLTPPTVAA